jgi:antitoxin component of MazEF toxin-antitoxin module
MKKKLTKHGNSAALIIEKPILDLLHINMDTTLDIQTDGKSLIISPTSDDNYEKNGKIKAAIEKVNKNHSETLKKLAK